MLIFLQYLLAGWAILLIGGLFVGSDPNRRQLMPTWMRLGSSLVLVIAAWLWFIVVQDTAPTTIALLIAVGMSLGFIGDLFMSQDVVLGGIGSFGVGHVAYIVAIWQLANQIGATTAGPRWGSLAAWLLVGEVGWYLVVIRGQTHTPHRYAALHYAQLLAATAGSATGLGLQTAVFLPVALGAALFLLSDLLIAGELFSDLSFPYIGDAIWLTYGPAQMLILYGLYSGMLGFFSS